METRTVRALGKQKATGLLGYRTFSTKRGTFFNCEVHKMWMKKDPAEVEYLLESMSSLVSRFSWRGVQRPLWAAEYLTLEYLQRSRKLGFLNEALQSCRVSITKSTYILLVCIISVETNDTLGISTKPSKFHSWMSSNQWINRMEETGTACSFREDSAP